MQHIAKRGPGVGITHCMATVNGPFWVRTELSDAETIAYMSKLAAIEPFKYAIQKDEYDDESWVYIELKNYDRNYRIIMGQLLKGCSEHKLWLYNCFMEEDQSEFFSKTLKYFEEALENPNFDHGAFIADHCWFSVRYSYNDDAYSINVRAEPKVESIREVLDRAEANPKAYHIWDTYLYETEEEPVCL